MTVFLMLLKMPSGLLDESWLRVKYVMLREGACRQVLIESNATFWEVLMPLRVLTFRVFVGWYCTMYCFSDLTSPRLPSLA